MEPKKINLPFKIKKAVLAIGSQTKNTICFVKGNTAYISSVHQDLSIPQDFFSFEKDVKYFLKRKPKIIAHDLHPEYQSTKYAQELSAATYELSAIQHHHAHIASCMAENGLKNQKVIGVAFDGTGLGIDATLWGAEFLLCDYKSFNRVAHLKEIPLLGGERAIIEPYRLALAWLYRIYKDKFLDLNIDFIKRLDKKNWLALKKILLTGFNSPPASSAGRLFDAAASLVLGKYKANFEAEPAIELEKIASSYQGTALGYPFGIIKENVYILDPVPMFKQIIRDLKAEAPREKIAYRFHLTISGMIDKICLLLRKSTGIKRVVLSGGVFQNNLLLKQSLDLLYKDGFKVYTHKNLACNDSCVSLGQALIANFRII